MAKKILIVDDEIPICNVLRKFFTDKGYTVFTSQEAGEAFTILDKEKPHILILDIKMPGMNGIDVLRMAKEKNKEVRVIMVSAIKEDMVVKEAMQLGAAGYLAKPFNLEELEKLITGKA